MVWIGIFAAIITFLFFKNKQENRAIDRHNRMVDKYNDLIESLKENKDNEN
jgi:hypothetical protein